MTSDKSIETFAYAASHDLKQPLRNVKSFAKVLSAHLSQKSLLDDESKEYLSFIISSAESMESLVNNLNEFATIETKATAKDVFSLSTFLNLREAELQKQYPQIDIEFTISEIPTIEAYPSMVKMLFDKLLQNSINFKSGPKVKIEISGKETDSNWEFQFSDNGLGVKPEIAPQIFQPFFKYHPNNDVGGSGLGLAICNKIVEYHNGQISYRPNSNGGATFNFTIRKAEDQVQVQSDILNNGQREALGH